MKRLLAVAALAGAGLASAVLPASASTHSLPVTIKFSAHGDSGVAGDYWGEDSGQASVTAVKTGTDTYDIHLVLEGSFVTNPGRQSLTQAGVLVTASRKVGSSATIAGTADYVVTANRAPLNGAIVTISGDQPRLGAWEELAFPAGTTFGAGTAITDYSLTYRLKCPLSVVTQTATEVSPDGNSEVLTGNILGC